MLSQPSSQRLWALPPTQPSSQLLRGRRRLPFLHGVREKLQFGCHGHKGTPGLYSFWRTVLILLPGAEPIASAFQRSVPSHKSTEWSLSIMKTLSCPSDWWRGHPAIFVSRRWDSRSKTKVHGGAFLWHQLPTEPWRSQTPTLHPLSGYSINTWGGTEEEDNISGKTLSFVEHLCPPKKHGPTLHHVLNSSVNMAVTDSLALASGQAFVWDLNLPLVADLNNHGYALTSLHRMFTVTKMAHAFPAELSQLLRDSCQSEGPLDLHHEGRTPSSPTWMPPSKIGNCTELPPGPRPTHRKTSPQKQTIRFSSSKTMASSGFIKFPFKLLEKKSTSKWGTTVYTFPTRVANTHSYFTQPWN